MNTIQETSLQASMSLEFYCDACVEIAIEPQIAVVLSSEEAGQSFFAFFARETVE